MAGVLSLKDRMLKATSLDELESLVAESQTYTHASNKTGRKWAKAYHSKKAQLKGGK